MNRALFLSALLPALSWAGPFDGTWTVAQDSMKVVGKPMTYLLKDGVFTCGPCTPPYKVKADGKDHKVSGHAYYDTVSVSVLDANTLEVKTRMDDKPWAERKSVVSADGKTLTEEWPMTRRLPTAARISIRALHRLPRAPHPFQGPGNRMRPPATFPPII